MSTCEESDKDSPSNGQPQGVPLVPPAAEARAHLDPQLREKLHLQQLRPTQVPGVAPTTQTNAAPEFYGTGDGGGAVLDNEDEGEGEGEESTQTPRHPQSPWDYTFGHLLGPRPRGLTETGLHSSWYPGEQLFRVARKFASNVITAAKTPPPSQVDKVPTAWDAVINAAILASEVIALHANTAPNSLVEGGNEPRVLRGSPVPSNLSPTEPQFVFPKSIFVGPYPERQLGLDDLRRGPKLICQEDLRPLDHFDEHVFAGVSAWLDLLYCKRTDNREGLAKLQLWHCPVCNEPFCKTQATCAEKIQRYREKERSQQLRSGLPKVQGWLCHDGSTW